MGGYYVLYCELHDSLHYWDIYGRPNERHKETLIERVVTRTFRTHPMVGHVPVATGCSAVGYPVITITAQTLGCCQPHSNLLLRGLQGNCSD